MSDPCEQCGRDDVVIYTWQLGLWCADCIGRSDLPLTGTLADAAPGRPGIHDPTTPYIWHTPDGSVIHGLARRSRPHAWGR